MTDYKAPLRDMQFVLSEVIRLEDHYRNLNLDIDKDFINAVMAAGADFAQKDLSPLNRQGDEVGAIFNDGQVKTPDGFKQAYERYCDNGWASFTAPEEFSGQNLPNSLATPFHEMCMSANLSWRTYPGLTEGNTLAIYKHGNEELKNTYLEKMINGTWAGTMCLTEPHAGTDLGLLRTKAIPNSDGSYKVSGTKIFITAGEHDLTENIVHLVLAKLPDAPSGSKGISLFVVPKYIPDADGNSGERNAVSCGSIEHKMGIKASATAVLNFDEAKGWLVGKAHNGLACMFTMMNDARFQVGLQGLGLAEMAFQGGLEYAQERLQSRSLSGVRFPDKSADPIIVHPDVRRMLLTQKALTEGCRMMSYYVATLLDLERFESAPEKHKENGQLLAFFIPIVKSFLTDVSQEVSSLGVQIYGGHGFIREWGMEQLMRDSRILMIYEGTNGIQALDFIGRKNLHNKGRTLNKLVEKIRSFCRTQESKLNHLIMPLQEILSEWQSIFKHAQTKAHENPEEIGAMSVDFLQYSAYVCLGYFWLQMAAKAQEQIDAGSSDVDFYLSKITTAEFYFSRILPRTQTHKAGLLSGADNLMKLDSEHFSF